MPTLQRRDVPHPDIAGAALIWLLGLPGLLVSVFLTVLKFRSAHRCDESLLSACQIGGLFDCGRVLSSPWSTLLGVPITVYSASYYAVLLALASCVLWRPGRYAAAVRPVLLALTWLGAAVVLLLASYAWLGLGSLCLHCSVLYALGIGLVIAAWLMNPEGHRAALAALLSPRAPRRARVLVLGGLAFMALTSVQALVYRRGALHVAIEDRCILGDEPGGLGTPDTSLQLGGRTPEVEVVLFLDLACPSCRKEFEVWREDVAQSEGKWALKVLHYPREGACVPPAFTARSRPSELNFSCRAAAAVECVEALAPGKGLAMLGALFAVQDAGTTPLFDDQRLVATAREVGVAAEASLDGEFLRCIDGKHAVQPYARIREHSEFGMSLGLSEAPNTLFMFHADGVPSDRVLLVKGFKGYGDVDKFLADARARVLGGRKGAP